MADNYYLNLDSIAKIVLDKVNSMSTFNAKGVSAAFTVKNKKSFLNKMYGDITLLKEKNTEKTEKKILKQD